MALNKDLNYVALNDNGAGKNYTNEEIEANRARAKAAGYGTATTVNSAYDIGQGVGSYLRNNALANANKQMAQPFETAAGAVGVGNFFSGLFGGKPKENPYLQPAIDLNKQANNYRIKNAGGNSTTPTTPSDNGNTPGGNTTTTPSDSTAGNTNNAYSGYYDTERNYQQERLKQEREAAIQRARFAYQQAVNPYGVQAEALASSGLAANGGYGQRMQQARYNAYANAVNTASNQYQNDVAALDRQLAYQKYSEELTNRQNAYANAQNELTLRQNQISTALSIGQGVLAYASGNKEKKKAAVIQAIKANVPELTEEQLQSVLAQLMKS